MKKITRSGIIDQASGTTVYTVPTGETASVGGLRFGVGNLSTTITVTIYDNSAGTSTTYSKDLLPADQLSDDVLYALDADDYVKIESTAAGVSYYAFIDFP